jgi:hypothetical protein
MCCNTYSPEEIAFRSARRSTKTQGRLPQGPGAERSPCRSLIRLPAVDTLKRYSKALVYEYRVKTAALDTLKRYSKALVYEYRVKTTALDTLKRYSILSLTLYLE